MSYYEIIGAAFGLLSVWLTVKENIWLWITGLISVCFYIVVFFQAKYYANMGLQVVFIALQIYGWHEWLRGGKDRGRLEISRTDFKLGLWLAAIAFIATAAMGYLLATRTDAVLSYWDSAASALSIIAQWMLAKKLIENWIVWIAVDAITIGLCLYNNLFATAALYVAFLVLAMMGLIEWRKTIKSFQPA
ncbi:MAG: nicotinamide riboside transporter PnuC [Blastocatellia bacterium]